MISLPNNYYTEENQDDTWVYNLVGANAIGLKPAYEDRYGDLVIEKDGEFKTVQCKATGSVDNAISIKSTGGTKGMVYDTILNHPVDYLFCLDSEMHMYVIPVQDLKDFGVNKQITLRTQKSGNGRCFQTYKYLVSL